MRVYKLRKKDKVKFIVTECCASIMAYHDPKTMGNSSFGVFKEGAILKYEKKHCMRIGQEDYKYATQFLCCEPKLKGDRYSGIYR